jgi:hypothetical protein
MASLFARRRTQPQQRQDPENRPEQQHDLLRTFLPASARPYETQRLAYAYDDEPADGPDEDIEFLASLVEEIERQPAPAPSERRPAPQAAAEGDSDTGASLRARPIRPVIPPKAITMRVAPPDESHLNVFRAMRDEPERQRTSHDLGVRDVDLDDLLEDLSTTVAAIRRRKAA